MDSEQLLGLFFLVIGLYLVLCSTKYREFVLYRLKVARLVGLFGERFTHGFYLLMGIALVVTGVLKATGIWGPPA